LAYAEKKSLFLFLIIIKKNLIERNKWQAYNSDWIFERLTSNRVLWREITPEIGHRIKESYVFKYTETYENGGTIILANNNGVNWTKQIILNDTNAVINLNIIPNGFINEKITHIITFYNSKFYKNKRVIPFLQYKKIKRYEVNLIYDCYRFQDTIDTAVLRSTIFTIPNENPLVFGSWISLNFTSYTNDKKKVTGYNCLKGGWVL
jgi:hypothetical protein